MANGQFAPVMDFLRRLVPQPFAAEADGPLLQRFVRDRDTAAFAALLQRYGPLVFGVCRRVLTDVHDAEDAFQATFLIFVRRAGAIHKRESVGSWLYGVAYRVARRLREGLARRRARERALPDLPATTRSAEAVWRDLGPVLDEEINRLPARYRVPFILCYLEGRSTTEAARLLGCAQGTIFSRLAWARQRLRARLGQRNVDPWACLLAVLPAGAGVSTVPVTLADATVKTALLSTAAAGTVGAVPTAIILAQGVLRTMRMTNLKVALALFVAVCLLGTGVGLLAHQALGDKIPEGAQAEGQSAAQDKAPRTKIEKKPATDKAKPPTHSITVTGSATDAAGKPVAGATIYLVSTNSIDQALGKTTTDATGNFEFKDARLPLKQYDHAGSFPTGTFQVFGTAKGHGFAWHGMRHFAPRPRPADWNVSGQDVSLFLNEPLVMDLQFGPPARLRGRVRAEDGRPIAGVKVRISSCDYLDLAGKDEHINFREFWSIYQAPAALTTASTDSEGRFELDGLPQDIVCWVRLKHDRYADLGLYAATTNKPLPEEIPLPSHFKDEPRPPVHTGDLDITLALPRQVVVQAVDADTAKPIPGLRIGASSGMSTGSSAYGTSDAKGKVEFRLPPGRYHLNADPPRSSLDRTDSGWNMDYVRTDDRLDVGKEPAQQKELRVRRGCVVMFEVVDADTGKGIRHATITQRAEDGVGFNQVQSSTAYVGRAETNAGGKLRAVLYPGTGQFRIASPPPGYEAVEADSGDIELPAGKAVTVRFTLRKKGSNSNPGQ